MKRQYLIFAVAFAALVGSLVTVFTTRQEKAFQLRGYINAAQDANLPPRVPRFGVNANLEQYSPAELQQQLDRMAQLNVVWVRQRFLWDEIEPTKGEYQWETVDRIVEALDEYPQFHLVAVLTNTPAWARTALSPDDPTAPPENPAPFAVFASAFAARYGETVDHYQIWDEPNLEATWGGMDPRPADYAALLRETYPAIHGVDASAQVIAGALAPTTETGPKNISDLLYLRELYALGAADYMDAVAAKPYGFDRPPDDRIVNNETLNFSRIVALREIMVENNDGTKPFWAMDWGWNSLPSDWTGNPSIWGSVSTDQQAGYTLGALDRAEQEWPWLAGMILHTWQPNVEADNPLWGFAIMDQQNEPTPLGNVLRDYQPDSVASNGYYPAVNPYAQYSGVWTFGELGADIGWINDSQLDFTFSGTSISMLLRQDDYVAHLYPRIDNQLPDALPRDAAGNAYIVLTSASLTPETRLIPLARDLQPGQHTLHLIADKGWDRWALAGYAVSSEDLAEPFDQQIIVGWIAVIISLAAVTITGWSINWRGLTKPFTALTQRLSASGQLVFSVVTSIALLLGMMLTWGDGTPNILRREPAQLGLAVVTAGLIYIEPGFLLTIVAAFLLFVVIYNRLDYGLALIIFWSPFFLFPVELYRFAFPMAETTLLLTGAAGLLKALAYWGRERQSSNPQFPSHGLKLQLNPLDYAVAAWVMLGVLSLLWTQYRSPALTELRVLFLEPAIFYILFRVIIREKQQFLLLVDALLLAGVTVACIGLLQFVRGEAVITAEDGARRLASVYGSPNNVGLFLGRCIPFGLAYLLIPVDRRRRLAAGLALGIMGVAVVLSQSVGAIFIGIPAAVVTVLLLALGKRARLPLLILVVLGVIGFAVSLQSARFARVLDFSSGTNFFRLRVWQSAINVISDHPITGLGLDQFLYAFRGYYILPDAWQEPNLSHPHNFLLDFWIRLGIAGVALLAIIQIFFWRNARQIYQWVRQGDRIVFALIVGTMGSMINLLAHGLIDNSVYVQDLAYVFILLLALIVNLANARAIDAKSI